MGVIVIGCGPAGSRLALELAKKGIEVKVYEKRQEIGAPKRCAEGISSNSLKKLGIEELPNKCVRAKIKGAIIYAPSNKSIEIKFEKTIGYILERKVFDKWLSEEAARRGAHIQAKTEIEDIIFENGKIKGIKGNFIGEKFEESGEIIVSAEGVEGKIAKKVGFKPISIKDYDSGVQFEMANIDIDENYIEFYFSNEDAPRGYIWVFPKGRDIANVGIGIASYIEKPAIEYLRKWINKNDRFKKGSILEINSGGIPVGGISKEITKDNFLLVGDVARQVNPIHGGGLFEAQYAAKIASEIIKECYEKQDFSNNILKRYGEIWYESRGKSLEKILKLRMVLENLKDNDLNLIAENVDGEDLIDFAHGERLWKLAKILMKKPSLIKYAKYLL